jgi:hypothetical protein
LDGNSFYHFSQLVKQKQQPGLPAQAVRQAATVNVWSRRCFKFSRSAAAWSITKGEMDRYTVDLGEFNRL